MEKGGKVLYNHDTNEIGRIAFSAPLYSTFPELRVTAEKITSEEKGEPVYSFFKAGTSIKVLKKHTGTLSVLYGIEWKIILVKPE
ncbi:MAG: hypothetical protein CVT92_10305 [Bacteroidetes bacterium HGW-Bacteroidetes-1]|nr:MAG: hypothetical protein CVT92_10305 [Bacteroidetes bacterium HGW-Bacteroidetes-1]